MSESRKGHIMDKFEFRTFPASKAEALALAYITAQDLTGASPEEVARNYHDAYRRIKAEFEKITAEEKPKRH